MLKLIKALRKSESGATAIEYGLIAALISIVAIGGMNLVGGSIQGAFTTVSGELTTNGVSAPAEAPAEGG